MKHRITLEIDGFGWARLTEEAERQAVSVEEVLTHATLYYLADIDSGRFAWRVPRERADADAEAVWSQMLDGPVYARPARPRPPLPREGAAP